MISRIIYEGNIVMFHLQPTPTYSTDSDSPAETIVPRKSSWFKRALLFAGPGLLVSVGYMDPGNWATAIEAGSHYGYQLLYVIILASVVGMFIQCLCTRLAIATGKNLAQLCGERYSNKTRYLLWFLAELSIIATDIAEVLGTALALHLLFNLPLIWAIILTIFDTFLVLALQGSHFRRVEAIVLSLVFSIALCFTVELFIIKPFWPDVWSGLHPNLSALSDQTYLYLAIGIIGATIMPHNLYLHSAIIQTRRTNADEKHPGKLLRAAKWDTVLSLSLALLVNSAILILASAAFHHTGNTTVTDIAEAYHLLTPLFGGAMASLLFAIALLAAGQSSTFTGTIAGQVILDGFLHKQIPYWLRRFITRTLALIPALIGIMILGDKGVGTLLVASQVVLSLQLPFALWPLIRMTNNASLMHGLHNKPLIQYLSWGIFMVITIANIALLWTLL